MKIRYQLQTADLAAQRTHLQQRRRAQNSALRGRFWGWLLVGAAFGFLLAALGTAQAGRHQSWVWALTAAAYFGSALWLARWWRSRHAERWFAQFEGAYELDLTPAGISHAAAGGAGFHAWPEIVALEECEAGLRFYLSREFVLLVPRDAFDAARPMETFAQEARRLWAAHPENTAGTLLPEFPPPPRLLSAADLWSNLRAAMRMVSFRTVDPGAFRASGSQLAWLVLLQMLWLGSIDYVRALPSPQFNAFGLSAAAAALLFTLAAAAMISGRLVQRASLLRLLVMLAACSLLMDLVYLPAYAALDRYYPEARGAAWILYAVGVSWMLAIVFRIVRGLYRQPAPAAALLASIYAFYTLVLGGMLPAQDFFYAAPDETAAYRKARELDVEDVFYRQPALVARALAGITPQRPGTADLYYVGFAGQAEEKVFANEVRYARGLFDRRFDTAGRSLVLANDFDAVEQQPLANPHNLEAVLQGLSTRMDPREDVLFLFLSSHGAKDYSLSVSFWPLELNDLKAQRLKQMLDRSGIRNRVIVVSACYSGGFVDLLKDDHSLILTASSRDHVSYGCGDATRYTYFGEAYFVKSLARGNSFVDAFMEARRLIETREKIEGKDGSNPQIHVGSEIGRILEQLEANRLQTQASPA